MLPSEKKSEILRSPWNVDKRRLGGKFASDTSVLMWECEFLVKKYSQIKIKSKVFR